MGKALLVGLLAVLCAGCATIGNPAILHVQPDEVKNLTQAQLTEKYGPPSVRHMTVQDGKVLSTYAWSYISISPISSESASFVVTFDEGGTMRTMRFHPNP